MLKRTILGLALSCLFLCRPAFCCSCHNHQAAKELHNAQSFVVYAYSLVFAADHHKHTAMSQAVQYLDKALRDQYVAAIKSTPKGKIGCMDSNIFTNSQDVFNGFFVEEIKGQPHAFRVYLFSDAPSSLPASSVVVKIAKQGAGWKITDILYEKDSLSKRLSGCTKG